MRMVKETTRRSDGLDQLGAHVGLPRSGDVHRLHVRGCYLARRPLFALRGRRYLVKERRVDFLDTHVVGDTAFVSVRVGDDKVGVGGGGVLPKDDDENDNDDDGGGTLGRLLRTAASGMVLGESATFACDVSSATEDERRSLFFGPERVRGIRGCLGPVGEDATGLMLEVDSFRIARDGTEHFRRVRNRGSRSFAI